MTTLSEETRATVKATVPVLQERGVEIVGKFYHILFESYPITASFFNKDRVAPEGAENAGVPPQVAALAGGMCRLVTPFLRHVVSLFLRCARSGRRRGWALTANLQASFALRAVSFSCDFIFVWI